MLIVELLFWFSVSMILYAYLGYPIILWVISLFYKYNPTYFVKSNQKKIKHFEPKVSLLISAHNEEDVIDDKIKNSLSLNYPKNLLEIIVVSDGSDDQTNKIVTQYADRGIVLRHYQGRIGKTACLNNAVPLSEGEIIVFSDANAQYDRNAIKELVKNFDNEKIGFVTGCTKYISENNNRIADSANIYWLIENFIKKIESRVRSCVGADGAIFAIRKKFYLPLKDYDINDLVIPLKIIQQGSSGIFEENANCLEKIAGNSRSEFNRQVRITNRTLRAIFNHAELLNPFKYHIFTFELLSHKLLKFLVPFFLLFIIVLNIALLAGGYRGLYSLTLFSQIVVYFLCWLGHKQINLIFLSKIISFCHTFIIINIAMITGWIKYIQGETYTTWTTNRYHY